MNCQPNDLARIVSASHPDNRDRIVTVGTDGERQRGTGLWMWWVECPTPLRVSGFGGGALYAKRALVPDAWMRPIRDPGADAVDETLERVGAPATDQQPV